MKIASVRANNRKRAFEVALDDGVFGFPYAKVDPTPSSADGVDRAFVDEELGREGFTYVLKSGREGSVHVDSVLEYNEDPEYLRDLLLYKLTLEAGERMRTSGLSQNEVLRRTRTSASQLSRLLDPSNKTKSLDKLIVLLSALGCEVALTVTETSAARRRTASLKRTSRRDTKAGAA